MRKLPYWIVSVVIVAAVALLFGTSYVAAQERGAQPAPLVNVQLLKDMTRAQVVAQMQRINLQLGTACTFCHVQKDGVNNFPADDKQHKLIARDMMKMVQVVNQQAAALNVNRTVDCWTCHRGAASIAQSPAPPAPAAPAAAPPAPGAAPAR